MLNLFLCELGFLIHHLKEAYEQEIGLKMLEMAILETQIFKIFCGSMPQTPLETLCLWCLWCPAPPPFKNPSSASGMEVHVSSTSM